MARLYANENFPLPAVERLRALGHDVLTSQDAGTAGHRMPDAWVLTFATGQRRAVLTLNRRHFVRLHSDQPEHGGIVVCSFDSDFAGQAERIHAAINTVPDLASRLLRVNRPGQNAGDGGISP